MDQDFEERLKIIEKKIDDNTKIVHKIYRSQLRSAYLRVLYWIIVILIGFGAFYYVSPYLSQISSISNLVGNSSSSTINSFVNQLKGLESTTNTSTK